ncbi:MAG TPA: hypothetical protein VF668_04530 [Pyrinomonadaceae bacterium]|jgi:hypothetical protein
MVKCVEAYRWPDSPDAIPEEELDEFADHAETCPRHAALLRAEEEELRDALRLESGLSGAEAETWDRLAENYAYWEAAGGQARSLALRYRGQDVARHEGFYEAGVRVLGGTVRLELEPEPGDESPLEIWKLPDDEFDDEVLLGVYPLGGFRHAGRDASLRLPGGQTVGLNVWRVSASRYEVEFGFAECGRIAPPPAPRAERPPAAPPREPHVSVPQSYLHALVRGQARPCNPLAIVLLFCVLCIAAPRAEPKKAAAAGKAAPAQSWRQ